MARAATETYPTVECGYCGRDYLNFAGALGRTPCPQCRSRKRLGESE